MAGSGGAWKVAYADFVTAMMAFFMVMWLVGQSKPVKQAVAEYFEDPLGMNKGSRSTSLKGPEDATTSGAFQSGRGPARGLAMANLKAQGDRNPQGTAAKKPPKVIIGRHLNRSRSTGTAILFNGESDELDEMSTERLDSLIPLLLGKSNKVEIRVYTPRRPLTAESKFQDPWALSYARCTATMKYLIDNGVDAERIRLSQDGELEPLEPHPDDDKRIDTWSVEVFMNDEFVKK